MKSLFYLISCSLFIIACSSEKKHPLGTENKTEEFMAPDTAYYIHEADSIIKMTFDTLSSTLKQKMAENGPHQSVAFCQLNVYPLTAMYQSEFIHVRRTSLKPRNPGNAPTDDEKKILEEWQKAWEQQNTPGYGFYTEEGKIHVMKPIFIQPLCLNCHGKIKENIQDNTLQVLDSLYPLDKARDYTNRELRGGWHITFFVKD